MSMWLKPCLARERAVARPPMPGGWVSVERMVGKEGVGRTGTDDAYV